MDAKGALSGLTSQGGADARAAAPPQLSVLDDAGARRATISSDGTVVGADGHTVRPRTRGIRGGSAAARASVAPVRQCGSAAVRQPPWRV